MTTEQLIEIYTDGSCRGNPGPGGWGALLRCGGLERELYGGEPGPTTSNRMELLAPIQALRALPRPSLVRVYSDSRYVTDGMSLGAPRRRARGPGLKNGDLWRALDEVVAGHQVQWRWVKAHSGHPGNERADRLAGRGVREVTGVPQPRAPVRCQAVTRAGRDCPIPAGAKGLCHVHDPALRCGAARWNGRLCAVTTGGGRCVAHRVPVGSR